MIRKPPIESRGDRGGPVIILLVDSLRSVGNSFFFFLRKRTETNESEELIFEDWIDWSLSLSLF